MLHTTELNNKHRKKNHNNNNIKQVAFGTQQFEFLPIKKLTHKRGIGECVCAFSVVYMFTFRSNRPHNAHIHRSISIYLFGSIVLLSFLYLLFFFRVREKEKAPKIIINLCDFTFIIFNFYSDCYCFHVYEHMYNRMCLRLCICLSV